MRSVSVVLAVAILASCGVDAIDTGASAEKPTTAETAFASTATTPTTTPNTKTTTAPSPSTTSTASTNTMGTNPTGTNTTAVGSALPIRSGAIVSPVESIGTPISITIASIGVESSLVETGFLDDGTIDVPADPSIAGWFEPGPRPGERGPAVIMGHVDSRRDGPGVFYRLRDIEVGATATIETTTGPQRFVVRSVEQYPKDEFPTDRVYGPEPTPALRLITCGGSFDSSVRSYRDNIIAFLVPEDDLR